MRRVDRGLGIGRIERKFGEAKIENLHAARIGDEDIAGSDVAMNDAFGMSGLKRIGDVDAEVDELMDIERTVGQAVAQRASLEQLHDDERMAVDFADVVDGADAAVIQGRGGASLGVQPAYRVRLVSQIVGQELESDRTSEPDVLGAVDDTHAAGTDLRVNPVVGNSPSDHDYWRDSTCDHIRQACFYRRKPALSGVGLRWPC